jgi:hypothetical protein
MTTMTMMTTTRRDVGKKGSRTESKLQPVRGDRAVERREGMPATGRKTTKEEGEERRVLRGTVCQLYYRDLCKED